MEMMDKCPITGKDKYDTQMDAEIVKSRIQGQVTGHRKMSYREEPSRTYQCEFCSGWHLTSQVERDGKKRIDRSSLR